MSVYEETFGTDWEELDREAVIRRAFALGVAEALGSETPDGEFDRLCAEVRGRYGRSMVELAHDEGRTKGRRPEGGAESVWTDLVESGGEGGPASRRLARDDRPDRPTDLPDAVSAPSFFERADDDMAKLDLPEFLR